MQMVEIGFYMKMPQNIKVCIISLVSYHFENHNWYEKVYEKVVSFDVSV